MSQETQQNDITKKSVVYQMSGMDDVTIRQDVEYKATDKGTLTMNIYYPPDAKSDSRLPAVIFVLGYSDVGFQKMLGCKQKEMASYISWGKLTAASGVAAITYTTKEPATDIDALLQYVRQSADSLGIDGNKIGIWSCSGNVPNALSVLVKKDRGYLKCVVLCYGYMLDIEESADVADASRMFGFVNPCGGKSIDDIPKDVPLFIVRAGEDEMPHLNETIDRFMIKALSCNLPVTFVNYATAPHAFDILYDNQGSREIIKQILLFMQFHLFQ